MEGNGEAHRPVDRATDPLGGVIGRPGAVTRRRALRDLGAAGLALTGGDALLAAAAGAAPRGGTLDCSVLGPTDPNRLMSMSATIDPAGRHGGPLLHTNVIGRADKFSWPTMPESLDGKGVSWKVYTDDAGGGQLDNVLTYFKQYKPGSRLAARGLAPTFPADFMADLCGGRLPQVSWLLPGLVDTEHPGFSTAVQGEQTARRIVEALIAHPQTWRRTALFITWDENGGFFDHLRPATPPAHTPGEHLSVAHLPPDAEGIQGPIGSARTRR